MWEQVAGWNSVGTSHDLIRLHCYCCCSLHLDNRPMSNSAPFDYAYIWYIAHVSWDKHFLVHWCLTIIAVCVTCTDRKVLQLYFGLILIWPITFTVRQNPVLQIPGFEVFWSFKFQVLQIQSLHCHAAIGSDIMIIFWSIFRHFTDNSRSTDILGFQSEWSPR